MGRVSTKVTDTPYYHLDKYNMNKMLFHRLRTKETDCVLVCRDHQYNYYSLQINGYNVMFAKNKYRTDGLRLFVLNDELAKCLGFLNYNDMRARTPHLQHSRKMLSADAIERHFY